MIRAEILALLCGVLLAGCDRPAVRDQPEQASAGHIKRGDTDRARRSGTAAGASSGAPAAKSPRAAAELAGAVLEKADIRVDGEPACALTIRYGDGIGQLVTWRGESCSQILVRLSSLEDLKRIRQHSKLGDETLEDLARMPAGRALYIEGSHSSALYPENVMHRIYEVPLAD